METYLAMTAAELAGGAPEDEKLAYMACHFSLYGTGLSNVPSALPAGSMLILNDRIPIYGHDPCRVAEQLAQAMETLQCDGLLLDFQRPGCVETARLCAVLSQELPYKMAFSHHYADDPEQAVFLPPPPLDTSLRDHIAPWAGRKLWLEAALETAVFAVSPEGCKVAFLPYEQPGCHTFVEEALHCRYHCRMDAEEVRFTLYRTADQLDALLQEANALGIEKAIGLYQQLGKRKPLVD